MIIYRPASATVTALVFVAVALAVAGSVQSPHIVYICIGHKVRYRDLGVCDCVLRVLAGHPTQK